MKSYAGPLAMLGATGCYVASDTLMKLAAAALPPYETLALRGVSASASGTLLVIALRQWRTFPALMDKWVLTRNFLELAAVLCYIVALANLPIANVIAVLQVTPLVVLLGGAVIFRERLGPLSLLFILFGLVGAVMIARPTAAGLSSYALLALGTALLSGIRDIVGRLVPSHVSGLLVALGASVLVLMGASLMHLTRESTIVPDLSQICVLGASGCFLFAGHYLLFSAYRSGPIAVVAPLYYLVAPWAIFAGVFVFGTVPDALAIAGIATVVLTGTAVVIFNPRRPNVEPAAGH